MKRLLLAATLLTASLAHAQVFIDQNIIRQAAENMTTGNIDLNNVQMDGGLQQQAPAPTAAEIAAEIRAQEAHEHARREAAARDARRHRVMNAIERAYNAEYRK